ncbi:MAG: regulatory protein RecX [Clostridiales bacterium]|nr:regulatory protein RecX [Clostridiales bacterium]
MRVIEIIKDEKKKMVHICLDDNSKLSMYEDDYYGLGIYDKDELTSEEIIELTRKTQERLSRTLALRMILLKRRTRKEVEDKLKNEGIFSECIDVVLNELEIEGYINDDMYAKKLVKRMRSNNKSRKQIEQEFIVKGLDASKLDVIDDNNLDEVIAKNLFNKKFSGKDLSDEKVKARAYNFLKSKGFSFDVIRQYIKF